MAGNMLENLSGGVPETHACSDCNIFGPCYKCFCNGRNSFDLDNVLQASTARIGSRSNSPLVNANPAPERNHIIPDEASAGNQADSTHLAQDLHNYRVIELVTSSGHSLTIRIPNGYLSPEWLQINGESVPIEALMSPDRLSCLLCGDNGKKNKFLKPSNTKRHIRGCVSSDCHRCRFCGKSIKRKDNLFNHVLKQHDRRRCAHDDCDDFFLTPPGVFEGRCDNGHNSYVCDICGKRFRNRDDLERHQQSCTRKDQEQTPVSFQLDDIPMVHVGTQAIYRNSIVGSMQAFAAYHMGFGYSN